MLRRHARELKSPVWRRNKFLAGQKPLLADR
jgi:hypothetical protein